MNNKISSLVAIIFLMVGVTAGVFLVQQRQIFKLSASGDYTPQDIRITNIEDDSFTVSWHTSKNSLGTINYGPNKSTTMLALPDDTSIKRIHSITIDKLSPETTYYFTITSGDSKYDNDGVPWTVTTANKISSPDKTFFISGSVVSTSGTPAAGVLVYVETGGASRLSTVTSQNGKWIIPLSSARTLSLQNYIEIDPKTTLLNIYVQGAGLGVSTAQVYANSADPVPEMMLGESYDFRNTNIPKGGRVPQAELNLPETDFESRLSPDL